MLSSPVMMMMMMMMILMMMMMMDEPLSLRFYAILGEGQP